MQKTGSRIRHAELTTIPSQPESPLRRNGESSPSINPCPTADHPTRVLLLAILFDRPFRPVWSAQDCAIVAPRPTPASSGSAPVALLEIPFHAALRGCNVALPTSCRSGQTLERKITSMSVKENPEKRAPLDGENPGSVLSSILIKLTVTIVLVAILAKML